MGKISRRSADAVTVGASNVRARAQIEYRLGPLSVSGYLHLRIRDTSTDGRAFGIISEVLGAEGTSSNFENEKFYRTMHVPRIVFSMKQSFLEHALF